MFSCSMFLCVLRFSFICNTPNRIRLLYISNIPLTELKTKLNFSSSFTMFYFLYFILVTNSVIYCELSPWKTGRKSSREKYPTFSCQKDTQQEVVPRSKLQLHCPEKACRWVLSREKVYMLAMCCV